jgi:hypothetical protein
MARAIDWAVTREAKNGGVCVVCNTGSNEWNYQVKDLAEAVSLEFPGSEVSINTSAPPDKRSYRVSFDYFKSLAPTPHQPTVDLKSAVLELKHGLEGMRLNTNYRHSTFMRIRALTELRDQGLLDADMRWKQETAGGLM